MTRPLSNDLRERLISAVEGGMSRRSAARRLWIYLDKPMRNHTLMQTIARANRVMNLDGALLGGMDFRRVVLFRALLTRAGLVGTDFRSADLRRANLQRANLKGSNFEGAKLDCTDLSGADLGDVSGLTASQIAVAQTDTTTVLPSNLK